MAKAIIIPVWGQTKEQTNGFCSAIIERFINTGFFNELTVTSVEIDQSLNKPEIIDAFASKIKQGFQVIFLNNMPNDPIITDAILMHAHKNGYCIKGIELSKGKNGCKNPAIELIKAEIEDDFVTITENSSHSAAIKAMIEMFC